MEIYFFFNDRKIYFIYQEVLRLVVSRIGESNRSWNHQNSFTFLLCHLTLGILVSSTHSIKVAAAFQTSKKGMHWWYHGEHSKNGRILGGRSNKYIYIYTDILCLEYEIIHSEYFPLKEECLKKRKS